MRFRLTDDQIQELFRLYEEDPDGKARLDAELEQAPRSTPGITAEQLADGLEEARLMAFYRLAMRVAGVEVDELKMILGFLHGVHHQMYGYVEAYEHQLEHQMGLHKDPE